MEIKNRQSVFADLTKFCHLAQDDDFIEVTEWVNGEGVDITFKNGVIQLTYGQLTAIECLVRVLDSGVLAEGNR